MVRPPRVIGLYLCDKLDVNLQTGQVSLVGLFQARTFGRFPSPASSFSAYASLAGGAGEGTMELAVQRTDTEQDVYYHRRWLALPGGSLAANLELRATQCIFPVPGRYAFKLRFDGIELTNRTIDVYYGRSVP